MIGQRTKDGLAARRAEGVVLGRPRSLPAKVVARIVREREAGVRFAKVASGLNGDAIPTAHDGVAWYASSVRAIGIRAS